MNSKPVPGSNTPDDDRPEDVPAIFVVRRAPEPRPAPTLDHHNSQSKPIRAVEIAEKNLGEKSVSENPAPVKLEGSSDPRPMSLEELPQPAPVTPDVIAPEPSVPDPVVPAIVPSPAFNLHDGRSEPVAIVEVDKKSVGEKSPAAEKSVGEKSPAGENPALVKNALVKNPSTIESSSSDFSPTHFSPTQKQEFSPTKKSEFSPTKKRSLKLVKGVEKKGRRGRPRNPDLPPAPGLYWYWQKARNGLKLEKRRPEYEYIGFIMPEEWVHLRGVYDEQYILKVIQSAIRVKRARTAQNSRNRNAAN